jgi:hypothetical protein
VNRQETETALREWLANHHYVIGYHEALKLGATSAQVRAKYARAEWARMHLGVYRDAASEKTTYQHLRGATVATAGNGIVSHLSAAWVWKLVEHPPDTPELTVVRGDRDVRGHEGITIHRSRDLDPSKAVLRENILVTSPMRTLVDIAAVVTADQLTEAVDNALSKGLLTVECLEQEILRLSKPGRTGVGALRRHLLDRGFTGAPRPSVLESHARRLVLTTGLPTPDVEVRAGSDGEYRIDIAWSDILYGLEVNGYAWHFSPEDVQRDEARRRRLEALGWTIQVYTWREVRWEPTRTAREITATYQRLAARSPSKDYLA